jgi:hypothetical protein
MIQDTSLLTFQEIQSKLGAKQKKVWGALRTVPNATNSEIARMLNASINTITPRMFELREMKLVIEAEHRKCRVTGRRAIAWKTVLRTWPAAFEKKEVREQQPGLFSSSLLTSGKRTMPGYALDRSLLGACRTRRLSTIGRCVR